MSNRSAYQPSHDALKRFLKSVTDRKTVRDDAVFPSFEQLELLVEAVFWASLRAEEGRPVRPSVKVFPYKDGMPAFRFRTPEPLDPERLAKLAPALGPDTHFGVSFDGKAPMIWGMGVGLDSDVVVGAVAPGVVVLKHIVPLLVLSHAEARVVDPSLQERAIEVLGRKVASWRHEYALLGLIRVVRCLERGGTFILVPTEANEWRGHCEVRLESSPPYQSLAFAIGKFQEALMVDNRGRLDEVTRTGLWKMGENSHAWASIELRAAEAVAQLTSVDGAVFLDRELRVLGFGVKLMASTDVDTVICWSPFEGTPESVVPLHGMGGTRHQSAVRFVAATRSAVAIVVSQDGPVSVIAWDEGRDAVVCVQDAELLLYGESTHEEGEAAGTPGLRPPPGRRSEAGPQEFVA